MTQTLIYIGISNVQIGRTWLKKPEKRSRYFCRSMALKAFKYNRVCWCRTTELFGVCRDVSHRVPRVTGVFRSLCASVGSWLATPVQGGKHHPDIISWHGRNFSVDVVEQARVTMVRFVLPTRGCWRTDSVWLQNSVVGSREARRNAGSVSVFFA